MTMHIDLPPEMETFIRGKVAGGSYDNATEVIRDALSRMQADEARAQAWRAAIRKGDDELDRGEGIPYCAQTLDGITEAAMRDMNSGKRADPDVLPWLWAACLASRLGAPCVNRPLLPPPSPARTRYRTTARRRCARCAARTAGRRY